MRQLRLLLGHSFCLVRLLRFLLVDLCQIILCHAKRHRLLERQRAKDGRMRVGDSVLGGVSMRLIRHVRIVSLLLDVD